MSEPKRVEYAAAIEVLREAMPYVEVCSDPSCEPCGLRLARRVAIEAAIAALEEHVALVAAVRAAEAMCKRMRNCQDAFAARRACDKALASDLVQRALQRDTESVPGAEVERDDDDKA